MKSQLNSSLITRSIIFLILSVAVSVAILIGPIIVITLLFTDYLCMVPRYVRILFTGLGILVIVLFLVQLLRYLAFDHRFALFLPVLQLVLFIGIFVITLAFMVTVEQYVYQEEFCFGLSCKPSYWWLE